MNQAQIEKFIGEALETEIGGKKVYERALECAQNADLKEEWQRFHEQTQQHEQILRGVCKDLGIDAEQETPGRKIVRATGEALVHMIEMAQKGGDKQQAQVVAAEAVTLAETKDHLNWELIGLIAKEAKGDRIGKVLQQAFEQVEDQEDVHLFHDNGWARELWCECLGLPADLPPPEEYAQIKTQPAKERRVES